MDCKVIFFYHWILEKQITEQLSFHELDLEEKQPLWIMISKSF